jgi:hypothetical protein
VEYKYAVASELSASTKRVNPNKVAVPVWETISGNRTVTLQADQHLAVIEVSYRVSAVFRPLSHMVLAGYLVDHCQE